MRKVLIFGDACCDSGFAKSTHHIAEGLRADFDITVCGINYRGDPHPYPYPIYRAATGGDQLGVGRVVELGLRIQPNVIVIQTDPWHVFRYAAKLDELDAHYEDKTQKPLRVGIIAIDGENCLGEALNIFDLVVFWTQFAFDEARKGGFTKPGAVIPLGVDLSIFKPLTTDKYETRARFGLPDAAIKGFWFLNVNRNQARKRLDLTIKYFSDWMYRYSIRDAYLYLHACPTGDEAVELNQLARHFKLEGHVILNEPDAYKGITEDNLAMTYGCADVGISTTQGEGWGLPAMEGMACGLPWILPSWSAYKDWARFAAVMIPCPTTGISGPNVIGGIPDGKTFVSAMQRLYTSASMRAEHTQLGFNLVKRSVYRWDNIGIEFDKAVLDALQRRDDGNRAGSGGSVDGGDAESALREAPATTLEAGRGDDGGSQPVGERVAAE